jgi:UDP-2,3-diacylglucosamine hydrolase
VATLFLADLHLPTAPSRFRDAFIEFCRGPARQAEAVYILGDLFEYWIGDDVGIGDYVAEVVALRQLGTSGVPVFFLHGNRDFLIGDRFAAKTGVQMLSDPVVIQLAGTPTLISHGDIFCTDDLAYQRWRRFSRNRPGQKIFFTLPRSWRERIAGRVRSTSLVQKRMKPEDIMDVNDLAIRDAFTRYDVDRIIHGHTHRPATHEYEMEGRHRERIVLADWRPQRMEYLRFDLQSGHSVGLV